MTPPSDGVRLLILDRDGVINEDSPDFVKSPDNAVIAIGTSCTDSARLVAVTTISSMFWA